MATQDNDLIKSIIKKYEDSVKNPKRHTIQSRQWFRRYIRKNLKTVRQPRIMQGAKFKNEPIFGDMLMFVYDAKHKATLPYYDKFPLVFMFNDAKGGWRGLNMHYLPPALRVILFTELLKLRNEKRYRKSTRLKMTWDLLNSFAGHPYVQPCVKHYLASHVRSKFVVVDPQVWEIVLSLPLERFTVDNAKVWADSQKKIQKRLGK